MLPSGVPAPAVQNWVEVCSARLALHLSVCTHQWCQQDDIMFPDGQRTSYPTLAACLLRERRRSQRNIHSARLVRHISQPGLEWVEGGGVPLSLYPFTLSSSHFICPLPLSLCSALHPYLAYSLFTSLCIVPPPQKYCIEQILILPVFLQGKMEGIRNIIFAVNTFIRG